MSYTTAPIIGVTVSTRNEGDSFFPGFPLIRVKGETTMTGPSNGHELAVRRQSWQGATAAIALFALLAVPACSEQTVWPSLSPPPPPPPPPPPASVAIEDLSILVQEGPCSYYYSEPHRCFRPLFILRETSGTSGATILDLLIEGPDGADPGLIAGPACPHNKQIRVPPGETSDVFQRDIANPGRDGYCNVWMDLPNRAERRQIELTIKVINDAGVRRAIMTTVDVP